jgi:hypothetical protein
VALRHLGHQLAERGSRSNAPGVRIPLYVNLKELPKPPPDGPCATWIKEFVIDNVRRGDADTADYIRQNWKAHLERGNWFFLFDSFDEIPAVLHAPRGSTAVRDHAEAIRQFLETMSDCRGILASREFKGPQALPWRKYRILPMRAARQEELVKNTFLDAAQQRIVRQHLAAGDGPLRGNPLYLSLLCRHVRTYNAAPANDPELLVRHLEHLAEREPEYTSRKYGLSPEELIQGATLIASRFALDPSLGLAPTFEELAAAVPPEELPRERLEALLAALVEVKIGRSDVPEPASGGRRFTFSHRRYQEALFVRLLARRPGVIPARELVSDARWREYAVALLQTGTRAEIAPLLDAAAQQLDAIAEGTRLRPVEPGYGAGLGYYDWSAAQEVHLLALLQEGLARRPDEIPAPLTASVERLLRPRWDGGGLVDRAMIVKLGGLSPQAMLAERLKWAVGQGTRDMQGDAFAAMAFLREAPEPLRHWFAARLSDEALAAGRRADVLRLEALCGRLHSTFGAAYVLNRTRLVRRWIWVLAAPVCAYFRVTGSGMKALLARSDLFRKLYARIYIDKPEAMGLRVSLLFLDVAAVLVSLAALTRQGGVRGFAWSVVPLLALVSCLTGLFLLRAFGGPLRPRTLMPALRQIDRVGVAGGAVGAAAFGVAVGVMYLDAFIFWLALLAVPGLWLAGQGIYQAALGARFRARLRRFRDTHPASIGDATSLAELWSWIREDGSVVPGPAHWRSLDRALLYISENRCAPAGAARCLASAEGRHVDVSRLRALQGMAVEEAGAAIAGGTARAWAPEVVVRARMKERTSLG